MNRPPKFAGIVFHASAATGSRLPLARAEVAIAGRSNAGKSSAINALAGRNRLAFVSKSPGRTQLLNFFDLGAGRFLVDLPGYGFAKVPRKIQADWKDMISDYLQTREMLKGLVVAMDVRRPLTPLDWQLLEWFEGTAKPVHILLTKADKLSRQQAEIQRRDTVRQLSASGDRVSVQLFSAVARSGIEELEEVMGTWLTA